MAEVSTAVKASDVNSRDRPNPLPRAATSPVEPGSSGSNSTDAFKSTLVKAAHTTPIGATNVAHVYGDGKDARKSLTAQSDASPDDLLGSSQGAIDPLSQHILKRTQTDKSISSKLRSHGPDAGGPDGASKLSATEQGASRGDIISGTLKNTKDKKKGVSFLSRFIGTKKKDQFSESNDNASDLQDDGTNGMDEIFAHPVGFIPRFPPPPKYIKVRAHYKKQRTFDRVFLAQELRGTDETSAGEADSVSTNQKAIWALEFSKDGKYLAAAGQDKTVSVWAVITNSEDREAHEQEEDEAKGEEGWRLTAPVFKSKPIREYKGHTGSVLDLSWSKNNFLLSSSMDRTVRLWHVSRAECLCCFQHSDFVTSIQFHPRDDRFFLAGSLDSKLRLWSIPDKSVAFWATVPDMITAVAFTPDGKHSIAGCLNGLCTLYETDGLKATAQVHVRSARGRNAKGSKITGIDTITQPPNDPKGEVKLLITSNDSRIRLYNFRDRSLEAKYRGNENTTSQIRASFSDDGKHIICGSEDRRTYIWPTGSVEKEPDKRAVEVLETRTAIVTCAVMAPTSTKQLLGFSGDPLYDLCNPPPITLVSQTESVKPNGQQDRKSEELTARANDALKFQDSPAYLARSTHPGGNIIIAADYLGRIKVFRQDCAYNKRPSDWDANSTFSRKLLGRSNSGRYSVASSIGRESKTPSERILAWRSSIIGTELASVNSRDLRPGSSSPRKSLSRRSRYSSPVRSPGTTKSESGYETPRSRSSLGSRGSDRNESKPSVLEGMPEPQSPEIRQDLDEDPTPGFTETGQSNAFWMKATQAIQSANTQGLLHPNDLQNGRRRSSVPSALSSDLSSLSGDPDEGEVLRCTLCRGTNFRATKTRGGRQKLVCVKCNTPQVT
ncbi:hypothetical protein VTN77DRAFT_3766 [Rasamsonia byssochlamydoides]|uniref:uncharacterized protein n=1 Tax=Rasamsonia byssochlamydoides TaxID=89139 RepID=UPI0037424319